VQAWHPRFDDDGGHRWLRQAVRRALGDRHDGAWRPSAHAGGTTSNNAKSNKAKSNKAGAM
jgi:hypothetical protein